MNRGTVVKRAIEEATRAGDWLFKDAAPKIAKYADNVGADPAKAAIRAQKYTKWGTAIAIGAGVAGAYSAHPFREPAAAFQEELFGDPRAIRNVARGAAVASVEGAFRTPSEQNTIDSLHDYPDAPEYQGSPVSDRVNGALIFGLYNRRLGG